MPRKRVNNQRRSRKSRIVPENRLRSVFDGVTGAESSDKLMNEIVIALKQTETAIPIGGKFFTFRYNATTPELLTDRYPLVEVTSIFNWGFRGINYHLYEFRNYNYAQLQSPLYQLYSGPEFDTIERIPYQKPEYTS